MSEKNSGSGSACCLHVGMTQVLRKLDSFDGPAIYHHLEPQLRPQQVTVKCCSLVVEQLQLKILEQPYSHACMRHGSWPGSIKGGSTGNDLSSDAAGFM